MLGYLCQQGQYINGECVPLDVTLNELANCTKGKHAPQWSTEADHDLSQIARQEGTIVGLRKKARELGSDAIFSEGKITNRSDETSDATRQTQTKENREQKQNMCIDLALYSGPLNRSSGRVSH